MKKTFREKTVWLEIGSVACEGGANVVVKAPPSPRCDGVRAMKIAGLRYLLDVEEREASRLNVDGARLSRAARRRVRRRRQPRLPIAPQLGPITVGLQPHLPSKRSRRGRRAQEWQAKLRSSLKPRQYVGGHAAGVGCSAGADARGDTARLVVRKTVARDLGRVAQGAGTAGHQKESPSEVSTPLRP